MQMFPWFGMLKLKSSEANQMALRGYQAFLDGQKQPFLHQQWYTLAELDRDIRIGSGDLAILRKSSEWLCWFRLKVLQLRSSGASSAFPMTSAPSASFFTVRVEWNTHGKFSFRVCPVRKIFGNGFSSWQWFLLGPGIDGCLRSGFK